MVGSRRHLPISLRLTLWYALLLAVTVVAFGGFLYAETLNRAIAEGAALLQAEATQIAAQVDVRNGRLFPPQDLGDLPPDAYFALYGPGGRRLALHGPAWAVPVAAEEVARRPVRYSVQGQDWMAIRLPLEEDGRPIGSLVVFRSLESAEESAQRLLWLMALALPVLLVFSGAGGYWLSRRALAPIDRVIRTARAIREGDLSQRIGLSHASDELGRLVATLDEMLDRLEESFTRQRQFTSNASHELRTPVAVVRAQAEAALAEREPQAWRSALQVIRRESERMSVMLAQMLELVRGDARHREGAQEPIDLNALVEGTAASFQPLADEAGVRLSAETPPEPVILHGDQSALTQALVNLVQNALDFTPRGGQVRISTRVDRERGVAELSVADTGVGIPEEDRPHIFERFYRGHNRRQADVEASPTRPAGGAGLGLSIVQQAVEILGGSVEVETAVGRGTTFTLRLPLQEPPREASPRLPRGGRRATRPS